MKSLKIVLDLDGGVWYDDTMAQSTMRMQCHARSSLVHQYSRLRD